VHAHDSVAVVGKGRTRLTCATVTDKAGVICQQAGISATANHRRLLTTPNRGYSGDVIRQDDSTRLTMFRIAA
jgi:uncharacterized protein (DUF1800 family)